MSLKSWWNSFFQEPDLSTSGLPKVTCDVPMPEVKLRKPEKDISEPVISFIQTYKKNHRRFKISEEVIKDSSLMYTKIWTIYDKAENKSFSSSECWGPYSGTYYTTGKNTSWATKEELAYIFREIRKVFRERKDKKDSRDRERLTKIYKGE